jgi:glutathione S-transferase
MLSEFIVHSVPGSPFGRAVLATLEEKGAPYRISAVKSAERHSPEHLARHPFGRVPVLQHGDFWLYETQAILRYIDRVAEGPRLTPDDARAAARMDQLMNINDWYLFMGANRIIGFERIVAPRLLGKAPDGAAIAAAMPGARTVLREIARLLGENPFLAGSELSLADLIVAPQMEFLSQTPEWAELGAPHQNLCAWLRWMGERPSFQATTWQRVSALAA